MNRILFGLLTVLPVIFWRKLLGLVFAPEETGEPGVRAATIRGLAKMAGANGLDERGFAVLSLLAVAYSAVFGLATDLMLRDKGFGSNLNGFLGFVGGGAVVAAWLAVSPRAALASLSGVLITTMAGSTLLLVAFCVVKAIVLSRVDDVLCGATAPARGKSTPADRLAAARIAAVIDRQR